MATYILSQDANCFQESASRDRIKRSYKVVKTVKDRDKSICQVCGFTFSGLEVHHIHALVDGGADCESNALSLCRRCHKSAPKDPDTFLEYQKSGGPFWVAYAASVGQQTSYQARVSMFGKNSEEQGSASEIQKMINARKREQAIPKHSIFGYRWIDGGLQPDLSFYGTTGLTKWDVARDVVNTFLSYGTFRKTVRVLLEKYGEDRLYNKRSDFPRSAPGLQDWITCPTLRGLVHNPRFNTTQQGKHQPLITSLEFASICDLMNRSSKLRGGIRKDLVYPLSGLILCSCGSSCSLTGGKSTNQKYYSCNARRRKQCSASVPANARIDFLEFDLIQHLCANAHKILEKHEAASKEFISKDLLDIDLEIKQLTPLTKGLAGKYIEEALEFLHQRKRDLSNTQSPPDISTIENFEYWLSLELQEKFFIYTWLIKNIVVIGNSVVSVNFNF